MRTDPTMIPIIHDHLCCVGYMHAIVQVADDVHERSADLSGRIGMISGSRSPEVAAVCFYDSPDEEHPSILAMIDIGDLRVLVNMN